MLPMLQIRRALLLLLLLLSSSRADDEVPVDDQNDDILDTTGTGQFHALPVSRFALGHNATANYTNRAKLHPSYTLWWRADPPPDPNESISISNNANLNFLFVGQLPDNFGPTKWAWAGVAFGRSMLYAQFIVMHYHNGTLYIHEHNATTTYRPPEGGDDRRAFIINPIGYSFDPATKILIVEFTRPFVPPDPNDNYHIKLATAGLENMLYAFNYDNQLNFAGKWFYYHSKDSRGAYRVDWNTKFWEPTDAQNYDLKLVHGIGMLVVWMLIFPLGVFLARYNKTKSLFVLHPVIQTTGFILAIGYAILIFVILFFHFRLPHHFLGIVLLGLLIIQASLGTLNYLGLKSEAFEAMRSRFVALTHHIVGLVLLPAAVAQAGLGLNIVYPFIQRSDRGLIAWILYIAVGSLWIALFVGAELWFMIRIRVPDPAMLRLKHRGAKTAPAGWKNEGEKGYGYVANGAGKTRQVDPQLRDKTPMQDLAIRNAVNAIGDGIQLKKFTWKSLDEAILNGEMYVVANARYVYDISKWIHSHPGGTIILNSVCGTDITNDYFHDAGFDASEHVPKNAIKHVARSRPMLQPNQGAAQIAQTSPDAYGAERATHWKAVQAAANAEYLQYFSDTDLHHIQRSRRPHVHTRVAIERLSSLLVGEIERPPAPGRLPGSPSSRSSPYNSYQTISGGQNAAPLLDPYEYRRYALTEKVLISGHTAGDTRKAGSDSKECPTYKLRFCLLYPFTPSGETSAAEAEQQRADMMKPFIPGECIELQIRSGGPASRASYMAGGGKKVVSRYYTPISGNMMAFEVYVKIYSDGALTSLLGRQRVGDKQFKIRGPFGRPLVLEPERPMYGTTHYSGPPNASEPAELMLSAEHVVFLTAGSGIAPALQMLKYCVLPEFVPLQVAMAWVPANVDELPLEVNDFVAVRQHFYDGWAFGMNLRTMQEGTFPLTLTMPPYPRSGQVAPTPYRTGPPRFVLLHSVHSAKDLVGLDLLEGAQLAYPSPNSTGTLERGGEPPSMGGLMQVEYCLSSGIDGLQNREGVVGQVYAGRVSQERIGRVLGMLGYRPGQVGRVRIVVCGPGRYENSIMDMVHEMGVDHRDCIVLPEDSYL
ncbi:hypothetical protein BJ742DRAFT_835062 [Cladochytrium replicatum]|nr:hypothetical protein BJ742DRAFT_835062 [Cladochytrium replicatum]